MGTVIDEKSACHLWGYLAKSVICENLKRGKISSGKRERGDNCLPFWVWNQPKNYKKLSAIRCACAAYTYKLGKIFCKMDPCIRTSAFVI